MNEREGDGSRLAKPLDARPPTTRASRESEEARVSKTAAALASNLVGLTEAAPSAAGTAG